MKKAVVTLFATSTLIFSGIASAQGGAGTSSLEAYLNQMYATGINWIIARDSQPITNRKNVQATNTATVNIPTVATIVTPEGFFGGITTSQVSTPQYYSPTEAASLFAQKHTADNVTNTLTQLPFAMNNLTSDAATTVLNGIKTADGNSFGPSSSGLGGYFATRSLQALTVGENAPGSDTLYVGDATSKGTTTYTSNLSFLQQPANPTNNAFNFANIIDPTGYTPAQLSDAKRFVEYAAQSTQDITEGFNFSTLFGKPKALLALKQMSSYQHYVMRLRTLVALRSMNINTLNQMIAERTTITGLGTTAGIGKFTINYGSNGQVNSVTKTPIADASPLQVEAYQANHRVEDPNWYAKIETASPATIQRDTLVVLAEIEHQNYEAHLDRERLLAAISAISLQTGMTSMSSFLLQARSTVNTDISTALNPPSTPKKGSSTSSSESSAQSSEAAIAGGTSTTSSTGTGTTATTSGTTSTSGTGSTTTSSDTTSTTSSDETPSTTSGG